MPRGYEYPFTLFAIVIALLVSGGGALSIDRSLMGSGRRRS
jgi:uncharacterized membrane protein YphA (DoxX/SURF4 family)